MVEITPRKNGVHSLAEGLRAFKSFHENPNDIFALKDSILRSHHGLETLFKHVLYVQNPTLLVDEEIKVKRVLEGYEKCIKGEIATVLDELRTVNLEVAIERLRKFELLGSLDQKEYGLFFDSVRKLTLYRNRLQHFAFSANPDVVGRILGQILPRAVDLLEKIFSNVMGKKPFHTSVSLMEELKDIFPEAQSVIDLLRHNYDRLIQEAITFFKGRAFNDQVLKLKIVDYGMVGAPPYFPDLLSEGFLNFKYDRSRLVELAFSPQMRRIEGETPYMARLQISKPRFTEGKTPSDGVAEGSLELDARMVFDRADGSLVLPDAQEKIAVLRGLTATIKILLDYKAEAIMTNVHYICRRVLKANGQLDVRLTAIPKGYESEDVELIGQYQSDLNEENAPFRINAFLAPDGSLKENYHLEWTVNTKGNVKFI